jgi:hypothetical protein
MDYRTAPRSVCFFVTMLWLLSACGPSQATIDLSYSARDGDLEGVESLLERGTDPNAYNDVGTTALMAAASQGNVAVMDLLFEAGADATILTENGDSALMVVANGSGSVGAAELLIERGADPCVDLSDRIRDLLGVETMVDLARRGENTEYIDFIQDVGEECHPP